MQQIFSLHRELEKRKQLKRNSTASEVLLWNELRNNKIGEKVRRQFSVGSYVLDFYIPKLRIAIEIDGKYHEDKERAEYDWLLQREIESLGIKFIRFKNELVLSGPNEVIVQIKQTIHSLKNPSPCEGGGQG